tara:strand:- start:213 stop:701 length:489 start_codon:yes stop_codon:yes gene_type:complete
MISHQNVIANVLQIGLFEKPARDKRPENEKTEVGLGLLPLSHIYGLVVIAQASTYRGDGVIILPKFEIQSFLKAIQTHKITTLYLVSSFCKFVESCKLIETGSSDYHPNSEESASCLQIRPQQRPSNLHRGCTSWCRNSRGVAKDLSIVEDQTGLRCAFHSH